MEGQGAPVARPGSGESASGQPPAPPPREAWQRPVRLEPVPDTPFALAILGSPEATSGPAIGSLVSGVAAALVALVVSCFGLAGAADGWGLWVAGAFAILAAFLGVAAVVLGLTGRRQVRQRTGRPAPRPDPYGAMSPYGAMPSAPGAAVVAAPAAPGGDSGAGAVRPVRGRGMAVAGLICGASALVVVVCSLAGAAVIQLS